MYPHNQQWLIMRRSSKTRSNSSGMLHPSLRECGSRIDTVGNAMLCVARSGRVNHMNRRFHSVYVGYRRFELTMTHNLAKPRSADESWLPQRSVIQGSQPAKLHTNPRQDTLRRANMVKMCIICSLILAISVESAGASLALVANVVSKHCLYVLMS